MRKINLVIILFFLALGPLFLSACRNEERVVEEQDEKLKTIASVLPQLEFVERIGGDKVEVSEMIPPGFSPATYDPSPDQLKKLQSAEIYFRIGHIPFEKAQMGKLEQINPNMKVVDTSVGIQLLGLVEHKHDDEDGPGVHDEEHEEENEDEHEYGSDPHIWLSPNLVKIQGENIYRALSDARPEHRDYFLANYNQFLEDLTELDKSLGETFESMFGKTILVFHPSFGYLAHEYGFEQEAIEIEGKDPSPEHLKGIIDRARDMEVKVIFVQKQFSTKSAEAIAREISGVVVQIDPLAKNYFENLREMADVIINATQ